MSFYSPEIAVLHAAFSLVQKQFGSRKGLLISSEKCGKPGEIIAYAVEEIVNGLEDESTLQEQIKWHEKLHDLLLYKVCQSHDKSQRIIDENTVLDKTDVLAEILPAIDGVLYTEIVKRCGWKSLCLSRLECIETEIGLNIFKEILHCLVTASPSQSEANVSFLFSILEFLLSRLLTNSTVNSFSAVCSSEENFSSFLVETVLKGLDNCDLNLYFENVLNGTSKGYTVQNVPQDSETNHYFQLQLLGVIVTWSGEQNTDSLKKWLSFNIKGQNIEFLNNTNNFPSETFFKEHGLGKYCKFPSVVSQLDLNVNEIQSLKQNFPWNLWQSVMEKLKPLASFESHSSNTQLSQCPLHVQIACRSEDKVKLLIKCIHLECSSRMFHDTEKLCSEILQHLEGGQLQTEIFNGIDIVDTCSFDLDSFIWRIDSRQHGYKDCISLLLTNKSFNGSSVWKSIRLKEVLLNNIDLLVEDQIMMRMYDLYKELEEYLSDQELSAVKHLITSAFVKLPKDMKNKHLDYVYTKYRYWPKADRVVRSGEITAVFNKLTSSSSTSGKEEVYKQLLQDPELVLENLVDRAISSKNQVVMYTEILKAVPDICRTCHHGNSHMTLLVSTLTSYLASTHLSHKEHRNILQFVSALCSVEESKSLLDVVQLLNHVVVPYLNVEHLYTTMSPITTNFSMEFLLEVIEGVPGMFKTLPNTEEVYLKTLFTEIHLPVMFLCICELAHECIGLYDEDDVFLNEKLKIKSSIQRFWTWLSQRRYLCHDFLQPAGLWLEENLSFVDLSIQLLVADYVLPDRIDQLCQNTVNDLLKMEGSNTMVYLLRLVTVSDNMSKYITKHIAGVSIQILYHDSVVALTQVLPNVVEGMWSGCMEFISQLIKEKKLTLSYKVLCRNLPLNSLTDRPELSYSQILQDVTSLLQFSDSGRRKIILSQYLKSYVKFLKEVVIKQDTRPDEDHAYILTEVFGHIAKGIYWMEESDVEPCSAILLDIVCSLEEVNIDQNIKGIFIQSVKDHGILIKSVDTASMINKKLTDINKTLIN